MQYLEASTVASQTPTKPLCFQSLFVQDLINLASCSLPNSTFFRRGQTREQKRPKNCFRSQILLKKIFVSSNVQRHKSQSQNQHSPGDILHLHWSNLRRVSCFPETPSASAQCAESTKETNWFHSRGFMMCIGRDGVGWIHLFQVYISSSPLLQTRPLLHRRGRSADNYDSIHLCT